MLSEKLLQLIREGAVSKIDSLLNFNFSLQPVIGIDPGEKRVGISLLHETGYPYPLTTVRRAGGIAERIVLQIIKELDIKEIAIGFPTDHEAMSGKSEPHTAQVFTHRIERRSKSRVVSVDEYLTSEEAKEIILYSDNINPVKFFKERIKRFLQGYNLKDIYECNKVISKDKALKLRSSGLIDAISAAIILGRYTEQNRNK